MRDNYAVGDDRMLMAACDRLRAFGVVMNEPIPGQGQVLRGRAAGAVDRDFIARKLDIEESESQYGGMAGERKEST